MVREFERGGNAGNIVCLLRFMRIYDAMQTSARDEESTLFELNKLNLLPNWQWKAGAIIKSWALYTNQYTSVAKNICLKKEN